jgi:membrane-associated phospholipid phosphatase
MRLKSISKSWQLRFKWNIKLFYLINSRRSKILDKFYKKFYLLGKSYSIPIFLPLFFLAGGKKAIVHVIVSLLITGILMPLLKYTFKHYRPVKLLKNVNLLEPVTLKSFPSADTGLAFTLFGVMLFYGNIYLILILGIYALLIAFGRIYMGAHFPIDVLVGALIGLFSSWLGNIVVENYLVKFI